MKKTEKLGRLFNLILGVIYIPLSFFSWLLQMASEGTFDANNPLYITLIEIFCFIAFIIPILCIAGILMSVILRRRGHSMLSFVIQFLPLVIFILNLILFAIAESLPATI